MNVSDVNIYDMIKSYEDRGQFVGASRDVYVAIHAGIIEAVPLEEVMQHGVVIRIGIKKAISND